MSLGGDLGQGVRRLGKARGFTFTALIALALGMGSTTAIFSVVDTVLLKPLPFRDPARLLALWEKDSAMNRDRNFVAPVNFLEWRGQSRTVEAMAGIHDLRTNIDGGAGDPEEVHLERVSASLFPMLGVEPVLGRAFREEEDRPGHATVALIGTRLWQRRFSADRAVLGKSLRIRDGVYTIVGVLPADFSVLEPGVEVWIPLGLDPADRSNNSPYLAVIGRMAPGAELADVRREMAEIGDASEQRLPVVNTGWRPSIFRLKDELIFDVQRPLWVMMGACSLLLLMSCVNVANLLLVRGSARRKEIAIRAALGATRARIAGQLLSESLLLAAGGGVFGLLLAGGAVAVVGRIGPANVPRLGEAALNLRLFLFALAVSAVCGLLFGLAPALDATRSDLAPLLNEEGRGGTSGRAARMMRQALAVMEIAIAVIVLIGSGLLIRSFVRLRTADPGFDPKGLLTMRIPLGGGKNASREQKTAFVNAMLERVSTLPGVRSAGVINGLPLNGALGLINGADFVVEGRPAPPSVRHPNGLVRSVTPDYFRTMRIPLIWGRCFSNADTRQSKPVIMVNRTLARQVWPNGEPMGTRLVIETNTTRVAEIIGVVGDVKPEAFGGEDWPMIYNPYAQVPLNGLALVMRTEGPPAALAQAAAREIHRLDPEQVITDVGPVEGLVDRAVAGTRFNMALLTTFAAIAFLLASLGVYGVVSYDVGERTNEIGVRMALGALPGDVLRMVLGQGARIAAGGVALGLAGAFWLTRLMSTMLYGVNPQDAGTFAAVSILLAGVALAASFLPSRRAMMLDPVAALRRQ